MPRPRRLHIEDALYFVTVRGNLSNPIFVDQEDVSAYLSILSQYKSQHGFRLYGYALTADCIQLCLEVGSESTISEIMHNINSRYTKYHAKRHQRSGHLFQGRYRASLMEKEPYLLRTTRYLGTHPDALATSKEAYGDRGSDLVDFREVLKRFSDADPVGAYQNFLNKAVDEERDELERLLRQPVVGSALFVERMTRKDSPQEMAAEPAETSESPITETTSLAPVIPVRESKTNIQPTRTWVPMVAVAVMAASITSAGLFINHKSAQQEVKITVETVGATQGGGIAVSGGQLTSAFVQPTYLHGTVWDVQMKPAYAPGKTSAQTDRLQFDINKVTSSLMGSQGFSASNYTMTPQANGTYIWETMQTGPNGSVVCWRGEWNGQTMQGVVTRQSPGSPSVEYHFVGVIRASGNPSKTQVTSET